MAFLYQENEDFETTRDLWSDEAWEHIDRLLKKPPQTAPHSNSRDDKSIGCSLLMLACMGGGIAWAAKNFTLFHIMMIVAVCAFGIMSLEIWVAWRKINPRYISFEEKTTRRHTAYDHLRLEGLVYIGGVIAINPLAPGLRQLDYWYKVGPDFKRDTFITASQLPLQIGESLFVLSDGQFAVLL
jgi:hypothetical protein